MVHLLVLRAGTRLIPLNDGTVAIGRLPECELALEGAAVSRRHARIVATSGGPVLEDRSRFGTFINGAQVVAPMLLVAGDVITVGQHSLVIELQPASALPGGPPPSRWSRRFAEWRRRYGLAELAATGALVLAGLATLHATGVPLAAALAGSVAEAVWFYGVLLVRARRQARREARLGGFESRTLGELARDLVLEFRTAELVDLLVVRPLALLAGLRLVGGWAGLLLGKVMADLLFYGPVLWLCHWGAVRPAPARRDTERERATSTSIPQIRE